MKKLIGLTAIVILFSLTINAQQKGNRMGKRADFTPEQTATLQVKKMALHLDLNAKQEKEIYNLNLKNAEERQIMRSEFQKNRQSGTPKTSEERFQQENIKLEKQIAHKAEMKKILTNEQFEKWDAMKSENMKNGQKRMDKKGNSMKKGDAPKKQNKNRG